MIVTEIVDLKDWQTDFDERAIQALVDSVEANHPGVDLSLRPLKLLNAVNDGLCDECGEAKFLVRDGGRGITSLFCRACLNAVRRQSLTHVQYTAEICWDCKITKDSLGIISGANHHCFPFEDEILPNGSVRRGLNPYIAVGRIDLTNDVLTLLPEV